MLKITETRGAFNLHGQTGLTDILKAGKMVK
jgi:hypothetical protein